MLSHKRASHHDVILTLLIESKAVLIVTRFPVQILTRLPRVFVHFSVHGPHLEDEWWESVEEFLGASRVIPIIVGETLVPWMIAAASAPALVLVAVCLHVA